MPGASGHVGMIDVSIVATAVIGDAPEGRDWH